MAQYLHPNQSNLMRPYGAALSGETVPGGQERGDGNGQREIHHHMPHRFKYPGMPQRRAIENDKDDRKSKRIHAHELTHWVLTLLHILVVVAALVISCWTSAIALNQYCNDGQCKSAIYITNTFYSTRKVLGSGAGWPVSTERSGFGDDVTQFPADQGFSVAHYYSCMETAQVADAVCPTKDQDSSTHALDYITCLNNNTATKAALTACSPLTTLWSTSEEYLQCILKFPVMRHSGNVRASQNVFRACLSRAMWPLYEVQQGIDSTVLMGAYNWVILLVVGLLCMTSFGVYTVSPWEQGKVTHGDPDWHMRLGSLWIGISLVWNLTFLVIFLVVAVRGGTGAEGDDLVPTTTSTSILTLFFLGLHIAYFLVELLDTTKGSSFLVHVYKHASKRSQQYKDRENPGEVRSAGRVIHSKENMFEQGGQKYQMSRLAVSLPNAHVKVYDIGAADVAQYYTPPLLPAWADGYLADPLIFLGVMGATGHVTTTQAWHLFFLVFFFRMLNSQICRYMYQCFMNNLTFTKEFNQAYHNIKTVPGTMFTSSDRSVGSKRRLGKGFLQTDGESEFQPLLDVTDDYMIQTDEDDSQGNPSSDAEQAVAGGDNGPSASTEDKKADQQEPHLNVQAVAFSTQLANLFLMAGVIFIVFHGDSQISTVQTFWLFVVLGFVVPEIIRLSTHVACQVWPPKPNSVPWKLLNIHMFIWVWDLGVRVVFVAFIILNLSSPEGTRRYLFEKRWELLDVLLPALSAV